MRRQRTLTGIGTRFAPSSVSRTDSLFSFLLSFASSPFSASKVVVQSSSSLCTMYANLITDDGIMTSFQYC